MRLEPIFWRALRAWAKECSMSLDGLIRQIERDVKPGEKERTSAIRAAVLEHFAGDFRS